MSEREQIVIAIDGFSSCGKSTLAKELARELQYVFIDTGAMYRGVTLYALQNNLIQNNSIDKKAVIQSLNNIELEFKFNHSSQTPDLILNGENVESIIRKPEVASFVSQIATIKEVRTKMVDLQRIMGKSGGIVMDGRDIGSVVFPNAELKLFVTADVKERTRRRYSELQSKGIETTPEEVEENLRNRDHIDSTREESPLIQTEDAIVIDNTNMTREEQLKHALGLVDQILNAPA